MSRYLVRQAVSTTEVERATLGGPSLIAAVEERVRRVAERYGGPTRVEWMATGRGVNGVREAPWSPGAAIPWWAQTLTFFAEVDR